MTTNRLVRMAALVMAAALLVAACTSGESTDDEASATTAATDTGAADTALTATGPSPGVTDDAVKIGITYVDTASLVASGLNYDLGDYEGAYDALIEQINADGGINSRQVEVVYAPIDPTGPTSAEEACVKLTEDEDVFMVVGFFLTDAVTCTVGTHATAVVDGEQTPDRLEAAEAPWLTWAPDTDQPATVLGAMAEAGDLDGTVGVFSNARDAATLEVVETALADLGIEPAETGVVDAPADDQAAVAANVQTIAARFEASGVDTVVLVGLSAQDWPTNMATNTSYTPDLRFLDRTGAIAFLTNAATTDTTVLNGSIAGSGFGPDQAKFEEAAMADCIATITDAGVDVPAPEDAGDDPSNQPYQAAFFACPDIALMKAWLEAAGDDLNYGTLETAQEGLQVQIPGDPEERTYGAAPAADGNPAAYLYAFDEDSQEYELIED